MSDISVIARHAVTVLAGQLAVMAFGVTDTIVAGRFSADALAALSVASAVFVSVYVSLMGVLQALLPVWAEQHGRGETAAIGQSFRQSLYLAAAASVLGMGVLLFPEPLLRLTEVPDAMRESVRDYLIIVGWALPSALFFRLYTTLNQALGRPQLVTWIQVGALVLKVPLSIWFTFGGWGIAPQGAAGCAWATLLVQAAMLATALSYYGYRVSFPKVNTPPTIEPFAPMEWLGIPILSAQTPLTLAVLRYRPVLTHDFTIVAEVDSDVETRQRDAPRLRADSIIERSSAAMAPARRRCSRASATSISSTSRRSETTRSSRYFRTATTAACTRGTCSTTWASTTPSCGRNT